ncbi:MAG: hypothetical protein ABFS16_07670 [Bacteroidota bacterium]
MNTRIFNLLIFIVAFSACQKEETPKPLPEPGYPTTYKVLNQSEWDAVNADFQKINIHEGLRLNEYGFVEGEIVLNEYDSIEKVFFISKIDSIVLRYKKFLGISEDIEINYEEEVLIEAPYLIPYGRLCIKSFFQDIIEFGDEEFWDEMISDMKYEFFISQKNIEGKRFLGPEISFYFENEVNRLNITNNWYPIALVPDVKIYTLDDVIPKACDVLKKRTGKDFWELKHEFGTINILIFLKTEKGVEIRDCWRINALIDDYIYGDMFFDTQTGELLKYQTRGIHI